MKMLQKVGNALTNVFFFKIAYIVLLVPTILAPLEGICYRLLYIMLAWGAVIGLYDFFKNRRFLRAGGMLWLLGFLAAFAAAVVLNFRNSFNLNVASLAHTVVFLLVVYPDHAYGDKQRVKKELTILLQIFIAVTAVLSTISMGMFVVKYGTSVNYTGDINLIGWVDKRLFGLYKNPCYMTSGVGLVMTVVCIFTLKADQKLHKGHIAFFAYASVMNFCSMCLENSRGAFLSVAFFAAVVTFLSVLRVMMKKDQKKAVSAVVSLLVAAVAAGAVLGSIQGVRPLLARIPNPLEQSTTETPQDSQQAADIDRYISEELGALTGRPKIWSYGLQEFLKKPVFGHGPQSHGDQKVVDIGIKHFHNMPIQCLVSVGAVGSLFIFAFFFRFFFGKLILLFKKIKDDDNSLPTAIAVFSVLLMFLFNSMSEVTVLFLVRFSVFLFWLLAGYLQTLLPDEKRTKDEIPCNAIADFLDSKRNKKKAS